MMEYKKGWIRNSDDLGCCFSKEKINVPEMRDSECFLGVFPLTIMNHELVQCLHYSLNNVAPRFLTTMDFLLSTYQFRHAKAQFLLT